MVERVYSAQHHVLVPVVYHSGGPHGSHTGGLPTRPVRQKVTNVTSSCLASVSPRHEVCTSTVAREVRLVVGGPHYVQTASSFDACGDRSSPRARARCHPASNDPHGPEQLQKTRITAQRRRVWVVNGRLAGRTGTRPHTRVCRWSLRGFGIMVKAKCSRTGGALSGFVTVKLRQSMAITA